MADRLVANNVDNGGLARTEGAAERRDDLVGFLDQLAVASHLGEDPIVPDAFEHVERVGAILEHR